MIYLLNQNAIKLNSFMETMLSPESFVDIADICYRPTEHIKKINQGV